MVSFIVKKIGYDNNKHYDEDDIDNNSDQEVERHFFYHKRTNAKVKYGLLRHGEWLLYEAQEILGDFSALLAALHWKEENQMQMYSFSYW